MSVLSEPLKVIALCMDDLERLLAEARERGFSGRDYENLEALVQSYRFLLQQIGDRNASIERLRKLVFGTQTESKKNVKRQAGKAPAEDSEGEEKPKRKRQGHGRIPAAAYTGTKRVEVPLPPEHQPGSCCPECHRAKLYAVEPAVIVRLKADPPINGTSFENEQSRCSLCGTVFRAELPPEAGEKKYDESVPAMVALLRYGKGFPMSRLADLQASMGIPLPASVQWELVQDAAELMECAFAELCRQAAQGQILFNDDTGMRILDHIAEQNRRQARSEAPPERTGTFTSGIVSSLPDGHRIVLYFTGRRHAGENLAALLAQRAAELEPPIQMCDALSRNLPKEMQTILSNCLVHARRQFVDVVTSFPEEVDHVVEELSLVYKVDAEAKKLGLSDEERLRLHQTESDPVMERLRAWLDALIDEKKVEPNSGLGKAIRYMTTRWTRFTVFLREPGAPLDNSLTERMLKHAIIHRKNSLFYKTENGAAVGDLYMSLIGTAKLAGADPFDYLETLQRQAAKVAADPASWMPWNYRATLERTAATAPP